MLCKSRLQVVEGAVLVRQHGIFVGESDFMLCKSRLQVVEGAVLVREGSTLIS